LVGSGLRRGADWTAGDPDNSILVESDRGEQTWHEMMIGFVDYAVVNDGK
jgi:hypothetical protein